MAMTYSSWVTALANELVVEADNAPFLAILPTCIDYAEQRLYRELDLLATVVADGSTALVASSRNFTLPTPAGGPFVTVESANVITPAATAPDAGTRNPLMKTSVDLVNFLAPSTATAGTPTIFAMLTNRTLVVGPAPDANYRLEVIGTIRPTALSASNTTTILTDQLPDLFFAASMIFMAGWQQNFTAQGGDNPQMAASWEAQYMRLKESADTEELRKKYTSFTGRTVLTTPRAA